MDSRICILCCILGFILDSFLYYLGTVIFLLAMKGIWLVEIPTAATPGVKEGQA